MCKVLQISRSTYYYKAIEKVEETALEKKIQQVFEENYKNYGSRKIKQILGRENMIVSRRKIREVMVKFDLVSNYTKAKFKGTKTACNESPVENHLDRKFNDQKPYAVVVSDLTYVRVNQNWNYICLLLDLHNREIIGYSAGNKKDAQLVYEAFCSTKIDLREITMFHTDRGPEFTNDQLDKLLTAFGIQRSLSKKSCPYDNAVAESMYKICKTEFVYNHQFTSLEQLRGELAHYVNWFNNVRIHGTLGYLTPNEYRAQHLKKIV